MFAFLRLGVSFIPIFRPCFAAASTSGLTPTSGLTSLGFGTLLLLFLVKSHASRRPVQFVAFLLLLFFVSGHASRRSVQFVTLFLLFL